MTAPVTSPANVPSGERPRPLAVVFGEPSASRLTTRDGTVWTRRGVNGEGRALYAPAAVRSCPGFLLSTVAELAVHGIVAASDAAPAAEEPVEEPGAVVARWGGVVSPEDRAGSVVVFCRAADGTSVAVLLDGVQRVALGGVLLGGAGEGPAGSAVAP